MLSVVCWKWRAFEGAVCAYESEHVNALQRAVARHYPLPHRFICVTDDPEGLDASVEVVELWDTFGDLPNPSNPQGPRCYRRLLAFGPYVGALFGQRFVSVDLDCVVTGDLTPLWERDEEFVIWGNHAAVSPYNASMFLLTAGTRPQVFANFNPERSPALAKSRGYYGSDQAWIATCLGPDEAIWTPADGVYSFRRHVRSKGLLPSGARLVFFAGHDKPWHQTVRQRHRWIAHHEVP